MRISINKAPFFQRGLVTIILCLRLGNAAELSPLPDKKMPALMPAHGAWEVTYAYLDQPGGKIPVKAKTADGIKTPVEPTQEQVRPQVIIVTRTDDIIREQITWENSRQTEKWIYRKMLQVLEVEPGGTLVRLPASYLVSAYTDYSQSDFPGFEWISKENYTLSREIDGRPCFIFTAKAGTAPTRSARDREMDQLGLPKELRNSGEPQYDLIAVIDSETLLPVFLDDGICRKNFRILPSPTTPLKMPPAFAEEFGDWIEKIKEARRVPSPP